MLLASVPIPSMSHDVSTQAFCGRSLGYSSPHIRHQGVYRDEHMQMAWE